jgi:uncharacterized protein Yka (UPF0111/DUF47 family)
VTVSINENTALERIAQLQAQIKECEKERDRIEAQLIAALHNQGKSLRAIGEVLGMSHVTAMHILRGYKAGGN